MRRRILFQSTVHPELFRVVLAYLPDNLATPWVTWMQHPASGAQWGHYHRLAKDAQDEYVQRCAEYGLDPQLEGRDLTTIVR